ncbi:hypothetical protein GGX14DRAFT_553965 [Mycena pura]|uniref:Uncharacterized protein n=1 Tax=Mycena pura TaxID=153505 RepID=A0AAD6YVQ5_9AGAR|nr:hypothetical protein GGX14DRAFT_553965 [Mycena pura]
MRGGALALLSNACVRPDALRETGRRANECMPAWARGRPPANRKTKPDKHLPPSSLGVALMQSATTLVNWSEVGMSGQTAARERSEQSIADGCIHRLTVAEADVDDTSTAVAVPVLQRSWTCRPRRTMHLVRGLAVGKADVDDSSMLANACD